MTRIVACRHETDEIAQQNVTHSKRKIGSIFGYALSASVGGIVVSIAAFQAVDPGSIPGHRRSFV